MGAAVSAVKHISVFSKPAPAHIMWTMQLTEFHSYCSNLLMLPDYAAIDGSRNGIQVDRRNQELRTIAFAVDASMQSFLQAAELGADMLFVHHGLFWGREAVLTGTHYQRIRCLLENDLALYAAHLPLDAHPELGNNICMAKALKLESIEPFGWYKGKTIGFSGKLEHPSTISDILTALKMHPEECSSILPFGPETIRTAGIISGGSSRDIFQAIDAGLDLFISGEADHTIYHPAQENSINMIAAGHYASETWGVAAMSKRVAADTGLETVFIDIPTGL